MAKNFIQYNNDNPVMAILEKAKQEEAEMQKNKEVKPIENQISEITNTQEISEFQENSVEEIKKILMNISIRESTKKEWKMFFLKHDLSMTQGIETAVEYLMSAVNKNFIKLSKGGITYVEK
jgi:UDP-galactopyranose mutase